MKKTNKLNILVTGGAGYLGRHVVKQLAEKTGYRFFCVGQLVNRLPGDFGDIEKNLHR